MAIGDVDEIQQLEFENGSIRLFITREEIGTYFYHGADRPLHKIVAVRVVNNTTRNVTMRVHVVSTDQFIDRTVSPPGLTYNLTSAQSDALMDGYGVQVVG